LLRRLVPAAQQNHQLGAALCEVHSVTWPDIDPKFADSLTDRLAVTEITSLNPHDPSGDPVFGAIITQRPEPVGKRRCLANAQHERY